MQQLTAAIRRESSDMQPKTLQLQACTVSCNCPAACRQTCVGEVLQQHSSSYTFRGIVSMKLRRALPCLQTPPSLLSLQLYTRLPSLNAQSQLITSYLKILPFRSVPCHTTHLLLWISLLSGLHAAPTARSMHSCACRHPARARAFSAPKRVNHS